MITKHQLTIDFPEFAEKIQEIFPQPLKFNIYDTEFYSKVDGSLDFGRTRYLTWLHNNIDTDSFK